MNASPPSPEAPLSSSPKRLSSSWRRAAAGRAAGRRAPRAGSAARGAGWSRRSRTPSYDLVTCGQAPTPRSPAPTRPWTAWGTASACRQRGLPARPLPPPTVRRRPQGSRRPEPLPRGSSERRCLLCAVACAARGNGRSRNLRLNFAGGSLRRRPDPSYTRHAALERRQFVPHPVPGFRVRYAPRPSRRRPVACSPSQASTRVPHGVAKLVSEHLGGWSASADAALAVVRTWQDPVWQANRSHATCQRYCRLHRANDYLEARERVAAAIPASDRRRGRSCTATAVR